MSDAITTATCTIGSARSRHESRMASGRHRLPSPVTLWVLTGQRDSGVTRDRCGSVSRAASSLPPYVRSSFSGRKRPCSRRLRQAFRARRLMSRCARSRSCDQATVSGILSFAAGSPPVLAQVAVDDPRRRTWTVRWGGFAEEINDTELLSLPDTSLVGTTQVLGDTDDGTRRTIQLRPTGQDVWCELKMHMSALY
jgi:hypothetical protein